VLGDTVNTAARLESLSSPDLARDEDHCRILVSEATLRHVGGNGSAVPVGALPLKGKTRPVFAFRIVDEGPRPAGV
jgi:class 3 adenylate cyclase